MPPTATCSVPVGSDIIDIFGAPCTCLAPLSCGSGLWTWRSGASITALFGGIGDHPVIGDAGDVGTDARDLGERLDDQIAGDAAAIARRWRADR